MYSYVVIYSNKSVLCTYWGYSTYFCACFVFDDLSLYFKIKVMSISKANPSKGDVGL